MSGVLSAAVAPPGPAAGVTHSGPVVPVMCPATRLSHRNVTLRWPGQQRCHIAVAALASARHPGRDS
jgi:hypothetical protein